jgi:FtsH-binding integral membrane protein
MKVNNFQELRDESLDVKTEKQVEMINDKTADSNLEVKDEEQEERFENLIRLGFIRKVYGILTLQLLITVALCSLTFFPSVRLFVLQNTFLFWVSVLLSFVIVIPLLCFKDLAKKVPINYLLLISWTICEAYMVACVCAVFEPNVVLIAAGCTLVVTASITLYACLAKREFSFLGGFLSSSFTLLFLFSFMVFFFPFMNTLLCIFGVFLYSLYLLFDTQMIMGKFDSELSVDDYILAALMIYLDIIQIFLYILQIVARLSNNN